MRRYIAPVAGLGNLNILGLIRFSIYQEGNGWFLLPILSCRFSDLHAEADHE